MLAASALESTRILLNSRTSRFPQGLGNSQGVLGHYLMDHFTLEGAGGVHAVAQIVPARAARQSVRIPDRQIRQHRIDNRNQEFPARLSLRRRRQPGTLRARVRPSGIRPRTGAAGCARRFRITSASKRRASACRATTTTWSSTRSERRLGHSRAAHQRELRRKRARQAKAMRQDVMEILDAMKLENPQPPASELERFRQEHPRVRHGAHGQRPEEKRGRRASTASTTRRMFS